MPFKTWDLVINERNSFGVFSEAREGVIGLGNTPSEALGRVRYVAEEGVGSPGWHISKPKHLIIPGCLL